MIKVQLKTILKAQPVLKKIFSVPQKIDIKSKLRRFYRVINEIYEDVQEKVTEHQKKHFELIQKYGEQIVSDDPKTNGQWGVKNPVKPQHHIGEFESIEQKNEYDDLLNKYNHDKEKFDGFIGEWKPIADKFDIEAKEMEESEIELDIDPEKKIKEEWIECELSSEELRAIDFILEQEKY